MSDDRVKNVKDNKLLQFLFCKFVDLKVALSISREKAAKNRFYKAARKYCKKHYIKFLRRNTINRFAFYSPDDDGWFIVHSAILNDQTSILPLLEFYLREHGTALNIVLLQEYILDQLPILPGIYKLTLELIFNDESFIRNIVIDFKAETIENTGQDILFSTIQLCKEVGLARN